MTVNGGVNAGQIYGQQGLTTMPPQSLASAHSAEVWAALGACITVIFALVALLYKRINDDIKDVATDIEAAAANCDELDKAMQDRCVSINTEITQIKTTMAQYATHQVLTNTEFTNLETEIRQMEARLIKMETEHALCFGAYQKRNQNP